MNKLIILLLNYYFKLKDMHYDALNEGRLGDHAFFDRLTDDIFSDIDDIQETICGVNGKFIKSKEVIKHEDKNVIVLLENILKELEPVDSDSEGTINLLNTLSQKYQQHYTFLRKYKD